jgi:hypothetical protein
VPDAPWAAVHGLEQRLREMYIATAREVATDSWRRSDSMSDRRAGV